jgi:methyltransferase
MNNLFWVTILCFAGLFVERLWFTLSLKEPDGNILDERIGKLTVLSYLATAFTGLGDFLINRHNSYVFLIVGVVVTLLGVALRRWSIKALGHNWSIYIRDIPNQRYVQDGPYRYFKHPYYLAVSFELIGVVLLFHSMASLFLFVVLHLPLLFVRVSIEDRFLKRKFFVLGDI